jgi:hypothetical protein
MLEAEDKAFNRKVQEHKRTLGTIQQEGGLGRGN